MRDYFGRLRFAMQDTELDAPKPYEVIVDRSEANKTVIYTRYYDMGPSACAIRRKTVLRDASGATVSDINEYAFAPWSTRETAEYKPVPNSLDGD